VWLKAAEWNGVAGGILLLIVFGWRWSQGLGLGAYTITNVIALYRSL
jgi:hypothetical protein